MKCRLAIAFLLTATLVRAEDKSDGFIPLFNGKNLDGWTERQVRKGQDGRWFVEKGILSAKAGSGWLSTKETYGDFVLRVEWRVLQNGNSGVFFRVPTTEFSGSPSNAGFEIQILDDNGPSYKGKLKPYQYSGGLYHFQAPSKSMFKGVGEWNTYEITSKGEQITVVYNGEKVIDTSIRDHKGAENRPARGYIGLQNHGTNVEFRKVEIKPLDRK